jgi:hypothetical protein
MSSINPNNINGQFPIAGQDNDSQGFRDNFTNVRNNLTFAKAEIDALEQNAILKTALPGITLNNEMNNTQLKGVQALRFTETVNPVGSIGLDTTVNWSQGHYQHFILSQNTTLTLTGWPTGGLYAKLRLEVKVNTPGFTLTLPTTISSANANRIQGCINNVITFSSAGVYVFEFSTRDGEGAIAGLAESVTVQDLTRNYVTNIDIVDYQYLTPANASVSNVSPTVSTVIVESTGTIAQANIVLPGNTTISDGHTISFAFGNTITALTLFGNGATISGGITTAGATIDAKYIYNAPRNRWFRMG